MFLWDISQFQSFILYITKKNHVNWKFKLFGSETCYKSQRYSVFLHAYFFSKGLSISYVMDIIVSLAGVWESLGHLLFTFWALVLGGGCCVEKHGKGIRMNVRSMLAGTEIPVQLNLDISKIDYSNNIYISKLYGSTCINHSFFMNCNLCFLNVWLN